MAVSGERVGEWGERDGGLLVVSAEGFAVHVEEEYTGRIRARRDNDVLCRCWI